MKKSELRSGMVIENRAGNYAKVLIGTHLGDVLAGIKGVSGETWMPLDNFHEDLTSNWGKKSSDIVKVYAMESNMFGASLERRGELLFTREEFKEFKRSNVSELRPYIKGEDMTGISVASEYAPITDMGMIARDPDNHSDQWYVGREYFNKNFEAH